MPAALRPALFMVRKQGYRVQQPLNGVSNPVLGALTPIAMQCLEPNRTKSFESRGSFVNWQALIEGLRLLNNTLYFGRRCSRPSFALETC